MADKDDARGSGARTIQLLKHIAEGGVEFTLKNLAEQLGWAPSTVHRLLQPLAAAAIVERTPAQSYRIGREFFRISALVSRKYEKGKVATPYLQALWTEWQETSAFAVYHKMTQTINVAELINTPHPLQYVVEPMVELSLVWGSLGRAVLAHLSEEDFELAYEKAGLGPLSGRPLPSRKKLREDVKLTKERGFALYEDRAYIDVAGIAAPIFDSSGDVIGALGLLMPISRFEDYSLKDLSRSVMRYAKQLSQSLGHHAG